MTTVGQKQEEVQIEELPFKVEMKDDHIELYTKPNKNLSKDKRKAFEENRITVKVFLFDKDEITRLSNINVSESKNYSTGFWGLIRRKLSDK